MMAARDFLVPSLPGETSRVRGLFAVADSAQALSHPDRGLS